MDKASTFQTIKYAKEEDHFFNALRKRVNAYFENNNLTRFATAKMYGKAILLISSSVGLYLLFISNNFEGFPLLFLQIAFYCTLFLVSVGVAHDGSHNAFSSNTTVNKVMYGVFDFIGINTFMWDFNHIKSHHNVPNVPLYDSAIDSFKLFRLHPKADHYTFHKYQHLYIFGIYAFATLFNVFIRDFFSISRKRIGFVKMHNYSWKTLLWLFFTKSVVIGYLLVLPLVVLDAPAWQILAGFFCGNFIIGIALGVMFMVTHISTHAAWPEPDKNGLLHNSFARHILATTSDFCTQNKVVTWLTGGLNHHVAHHLFPGISQIHLPAVTKIVMKTAKEYNVTYKAYPSVTSAVASHIETIKKLGNPILFSSVTG